MCTRNTPVKPLPQGIKLLPRVEESREGVFFGDWLKLAIKPLPSPTERGGNTKKETRRPVGESRGEAHMA